MKPEGVAKGEQMKPKGEQKERLRDSKKPKGGPEIANSVTRGSKGDEME